MVSVTTNRLKDDRYYTPAGVVEQMWERFRQLPVLPHRSATLRILDPAVGLGVYPMCALKYYPKAHYVLLDKDERPSTLRCLRRHVARIRKAGGTAEIIIGDYLEYESEEKFDIIGSNPPFSLLEAYLDKSRSLLTNAGRLVFLLRTEWGQSGPSLPILQRHFPVWKWQITGGRTSFRKDGQTDTGEYSHWGFKRADVASRTIPVEYLPPLPDSKSRRWGRHIPGMEVMLPLRRRV